VFAYHSAEIEFVFGRWIRRNFRGERRIINCRIDGDVLDDFAKNGDPNGAGVAAWPKYEEQSGFQVMQLMANPHAESDKQRAQFEFLNRAKGPAK